MLWGGGRLKPIHGVRVLVGISALKETISVVLVDPFLVMITSWLLQVIGNGRTLLWHTGLESWHMQSFRAGTKGPALTALLPGQSSQPHAMLSIGSGFAQFKGRLFEWTTKFSSETPAACGAMLGVFKWICSSPFASYLVSNKMRNSFWRQNSSRKSTSKPTWRQMGMHN